MPTTTALCQPRPAGKPWPFAEAADFLGVCEKSLRRLAKANQLRVTRIGEGRVLIPDTEVRRLAGE